MTTFTQTQIEEAEIVIRNLGADFHSGMIDPLEYTREINSLLSQVIQNTREERDKDWLKYLRSYHRSAHDDLYREDQEMNPCKGWSYEKIDDLTHLSAQTLTASKE